MLRRKKEKNIFFYVDIVVRNKLKCGLSWFVLLWATSTRHYSLSKHLFLHVGRVCKTFWRESLTRTSSSFAWCIACTFKSESVFPIVDKSLQRFLSLSLILWWHFTDWTNWHNFFSKQNAEIVACISFRKSRHKPNLKSTSNYGFSPRFGEKMVAFWGCAGKLSWTLFSLTLVQSGSGEFRDWTNRSCARSTAKLHCPAKKKK